MLLFSFFSCTLHGYYEVWASTQESGGNVGFRKSINYNSFRQSWYAFLGMLDIDFEEGVNCRHCGLIPEQVVCDATSIGYQRKFATIALSQVVDEKKVYKRFS